MTGLRYFFRSINVFNGLILLAVATVFYYLVIPFLSPTVQMSPPEVKATAVLPDTKAASAPSATAADYALISDQNLFHPERRIPPEKKPEGIIPKPDVFLYGTLITDEGSFAFIEDRKSLHSTPGRGKRQTSLKKGDSLNGYILREVEANRIVLVKGDENVVVMLDDREKRKASEASQSQAAAITAPGGPAPVLPGAPSLPQAAASPGPGIGGPGSQPPAQPSVSPFPQAAATLGPGSEPGSDLSTRRARVQEVQRIKAERQMNQ